MQAMFAIINFTNLAIFVFATAIPVIALLVAHHYLAKDSASDEKH